MAEVVQGTDVQAARASDQKAGTFKELAKTYINERAKKKNRSWQQADYLINKHLLPRWANLNARSITQGDVLAVFNYLTDSGSLVLANRVLSTASAVFSWGSNKKC